MDGLVENATRFLWYTQHKLEYMALNKNHQIVQNQHAKLKLLF